MADHGELELCSVEMKLAFIKRYLKFRICLHIKSRHRQLQADIKEKRKNRKRNEVVN